MKLKKSFKQVTWSVPSIPPSTNAVIQSANCLPSNPVFFLTSSMIVSYLFFCRVPELAMGRICLTMCCVSPQFPLLKIRRRKRKCTFYNTSTNLSFCQSKIAALCRSASRNFPVDHRGRDGFSNCGAVLSRGKQECISFAFEER